MGRRSPCAVNDRFKSQVQIKSLVPGVCIWPESSHTLANDNIALSIAERATKFSINAEAPNPFAEHIEK